MADEPAGRMGRALCRPPPIARLRWYAARLRAMSAREVVHRLGEAWTRRRWRRRPLGWDAEVGDGPIRADALLRDRLAAAASWPGVAIAARRARDGRLTLLGRDWPRADWAAGAGAPFWLHDPVTGRPWAGPPRHAFAIDPRATGTDPDGPRLGDAKYVWEAGRLQFLQPLAARACADPAAGATILAILRDFMDANPPCAGIHWVSGIEMALRLVSVTLCCAALDAARLPAPERILIRRFVQAHAAYLAAFPSLHSSANNHRMAEGLGLFLAGRLLPDLGAAWTREGRAIIESMVPRLVLADGGGAEQSPVYLAFALEMAGFAALLAAVDGAPLAADVTRRLGRGAVFLRALLDENGQAPAIGDDDETRVIAQPPDREPRYVAGVVAAIAGLTGRPDLLPPARDPHLRDAVFAVPAGAGAAVAGLHAFPEAGYTVAHETVGGRRVHLVFDHGPLGHGTLAAHGHADALAVWLAIDGEPVLVDAGTWLYFSGGAERLRLRESPSHNSVAVHGASQSRAASAFGWSSRARARLVARTDGPDWSVTASHDGYRRRFGLDHRRRVAREGDTLAIADSLVGAEAPAPAEIGFLLPAALDVTVAGRSVAIARDGVGLCRILAPEGFAVALRSGCGEGAVRAPAFGTIEDARRLVLTGPLGGAEAVTRLCFAPAERPDSLARESLHDAVSGR